jgi:SAM-dependent methyltransferase
MPDVTPRNEAFAQFERRGWEDRAVCAAYDATLGAVTRQCIDALLRAANVRPGARVLDVATGAGAVIAEAIVRGARGWGVDFSAAQLDLARARQPGVEFRQASADALPFADASFEAVVCNFGMPHFPDPAAALGEACRVLAPGGRLAFSVWDVPERAVGFGAVYAAIREHGTLDVGLPAGPSFFLFSEPGRSVDALTQAGFAGAGTTLVEQTWLLRDADALFEAVLEGSVRAAATLRAQQPAALGAIRAALRARLERYRADGGYRIPMPALLAAGTKPG